MKIQAITIDPEILGGTPVFTGTRVPIQSLFDWLETETLDDFLENFPSVQREQALDVLRHAEKLVPRELGHLNLLFPIGSALPERAS